KAASFQAEVDRRRESCTIPAFRRVEAGHHSNGRFVCRVSRAVSFGRLRDAGQPERRETGIRRCVLDLPLAAVADTLTLPVTVPAALKALADGPGGESRGLARSNQP